MKEGRYEDVEIPKRLQRDDRLTFTPSRITDEGSWDSYDDRNMIEFAATKKGIVVSNDQFRDLLDYYAEEKPENYRLHREQIKERTLGFCFMLDDFKPAPDPLGKQHKKVSLEVFRKY